MHFSLGGLGISHRGYLSFIFWVWLHSTFSKSSSVKVKSSIGITNHNIFNRELVITKNNGGKKIKDTLKK